MWNQASAIMLSECVVEPAGSVNERRYVYFGRLKIKRQNDGSKEITGNKQGRKERRNRRDARQFGRIELKGE